MTNSVQSYIKDSTFDKIWAYYKNPGKVVLTPKQEEKRIRWLTLFTMRLNFHSRLQAINAYIDQQKAIGIEISQSQAFKDMSKAMLLFGDVHKSNKQASLVILEEYAHKTFLMAFKQKNPIAMVAALGKLDKYTEIDKQDSINFNPAKLEDKPDYFSLPKQIVEAIAKKLETGVIDFNTLEIEDAVYDEITGEEDGEDED